MTELDELQRCGWPKSQLALDYHDREWGVPQHHDHWLFEMVILDGAQAGLSWEIILQKRENYRQAMDNFDPVKIARYGEAKLAKLLANPGIVRNRLKIASAVTNAKAFLAVQKEFDSFDKYIWQFVDGRPRVNAWKSTKQIPTRSPESDAMSKDLIRRGFKFVGTTICYAFMQAAGMVNDHLVECFRHEQVSKGM